MKILKQYFPLILVILLSYFAVKPLFAWGFFPMHDDTQVARVYEMGKALKDGMFPVRWVADLGYGYGYPIFNFYAPLAYYVGGFFTLLNFDALISTKIMMGLGIILSGVFMYFLAKEFWGKSGGIVASLFYVYAPYHAVDIYVRGDVGEFWAYAFIPLVFLGLWKVYKEEKKWGWIAVGSLGYAGVILSHNLTAAMVTPFMIIAILLCCYIAYKNRKFSILSASWRIQFSILFIGLLISSFYWVPAIFEMHYTNVLSQIGGGADFKDHFVCPAQLWNSQWGFGGSVPGCIDGMSFKIGKLHVLLSLFTFLFLIGVILSKKLREFFHSNDTYYYSERKTAIIFSFLGLITSILLMLELSKSFWQTIPFMAFFQYPWRFLIIASFFSSFLSGAIIPPLEGYLSKNRYAKGKYLALSILLLTLVFFNFKYFYPQTILDKSVNSYINETELKWVVSKISDEYMPKDFTKISKNKIAKNKIISHAGSVTEYSEKTQIVMATITTPIDQNLIVNIAYFPAWKVFINGVEAEFEITNKGFLIPLPSGRHRIILLFKGTDLERVSNWVSIAGFLFLVIGIIIPIIKKKNEKTKH